MRVGQLNLERHLLVLDLDETLLYADKVALPWPPHHEIPPYNIYLRPGLERFVAFAREHFRVAVWTSSSPLYAEAVCRVVFPDPSALEFVWASNRCTPTRDLDNDSWTQAKRLRKLRRRGYDLRRLIMVDDSPEKHTKNYGNLVRVAPFHGEPGDRELDLLIDYLGRLAQHDNVRAVEKRNWRSNARQA